MKQISMNNRILTGLLAFVLLFVGICFSVGDTYSRYQNEKNETVVWNGELAPYTYEFLENTSYISPSSLSPIETVAVAAETETLEETEAYNPETVTLSAENSTVESAASTTESSSTEDTSSTEAASTEDTSAENTSTESTSTETSTENQTEGTLTTVDNGIVTLKNPSEDGITLLRITFPTDCDTAILALDDNRTFLLGTRYSYDGVTGYQLNQEGYINVEGEGEILLVLETPDSTILNGETRTIKAVFFKESVRQSYSETQITRGSDALWSISLGSEKKIMGEKGIIKWNVKNLLADSSIETTFEYLTKDGYTEIPVKKSITSATTTEESAVVITATNSETKKAQAGTYRMVVTQTYSLSDSMKVQLRKTTVPFFVNYR